MKGGETMGSAPHDDSVPILDNARKTGRLPRNSVRAFQNIIYSYYITHSRDFSWRRTRDPYAIFVSEIMLQQTQTARVVKKYEGFLNIFPDFRAIAHASLEKILRAWSGLGYNRRAIALKEIANTVLKELNGSLPSSVEELAMLPGIGKTTAAAIAAFAFDRPAVFIETNIRRVFIHFFFEGRTDVKDVEILPLVERTLDRSNPREWYYALMDYGAMLKKKHQNPNRRSAHYRTQRPFENSDRQVRGMILKTVIRESNLSEYEIVRRLGKSREKVQKSLVQLEKEGFIRRRGKRVTIA